MGNKEKGKEKKIEVGDLGWAMIFFSLPFFSDGQEPSRSGDC